MRVGFEDFNRAHAVASPSPLEADRDPHLTQGVEAKVMAFKPIGIDGLLIAGAGPDQGDYPGPFQSMMHFFVAASDMIKHHEEHEGHEGKRSSNALNVPWCGCAG